jgi:hypothetical protein
VQSKSVRHKSNRRQGEEIERANRSGERFIALAMYPGTSNLSQQENEANKKLTMWRGALGFLYEAEWRVAASTLSPLHRSSKGLPHTK